MTATACRRAPTQARRRTLVLGPVIGLVLLGLCGLLVLATVHAEVGTAGIVVGTTCALLPVGPVVATFLWVDRWEPEPPRLLLLAFAWGAGFAALASLLINSTAHRVADMILGQGGGDVVGLVVVAPVVEEAMKGAFLVGLLRRREFDGVVDGIVYAGLVATGFAFTENILYLGRAFTEGDMAGQSATVLGVLYLRGVLSPFAHPLFTAMTGIAAGVVASGSGPKRVVGLALGYLAAVLLHALWNGSASFGTAGFYGVYLSVMVPLFLGSVVLILWQRRREQRTVAAQLPGFAQAGWIALSEVSLLASLAGRRGWRSAVRRRSGASAARAVADYQAAVTELAFLRARIARGAVGVWAPQWHERLLHELFAARRRAIGRPEALTAAWRLPPPGWRPPPPTWQPPGGRGPAPQPPPGGPPRPGPRPDLRPDPGAGRRPPGVGHPRRPHP